LTLSLASQRRLDEVWVPGTARIRTVRTAAGCPAGYESSDSSDCLPPRFSRSTSDVSDGQSTSPARRHGARWAKDLQTPELTEERFQSVPFDEAGDASAVAGTLNRVTIGVTAAPAVTSTSVDARPEMIDAAVTAAIGVPPRSDVATDPPTTEEIAAWQLPPQIDFDDIVTIMVERPEASLADLQRTVESVLPRPDQTPYGAAATLLAFRAMHAYERHLAEHLRRVTTAAFLDDATGWTGLRRCGQHLNETLRRHQPTRPAAEEPMPISSDED